MSAEQQTVEWWRSFKLIPPLSREERKNVRDAMWHYRNHLLGCRPPWLVRAEMRQHGQG